MKKTILGIAVAAFVGGAGLTLTTTPASAICPPCMAAVLLSKEDKNFKPVNPYAPQKATKKTGKKSAKKSSKKGKKKA